ncbi:hypothetical protein DWB77_03435 [Streptomyces hundungensis]|uniref:SH3b domain-containing protein n=2 Tax=Streptomyces hundungensis TaxID=1077946 RepID=A0A387HCS7_9ACTN|nr:hypothetical protein DWB77_03435 [Streptomyces hundungensis]
MGEYMGEMGMTAESAETATGASETAAPKTVMAAPETAMAASEMAMTASLGTHRYPVAPGCELNVRSGPGTGYSIVDVLPLGASVPVNCQTPGTTVSGPYGTSNIWDNIGNGRFVADAYVKTGSDGYVAPRCG